MSSTILSNFTYALQNTCNSLNYQILSYLLTVRTYFLFAAWNASNLTDTLFAILRVIQCSHRISNISHIAWTFCSIYTGLSIPKFTLWTLAQFCSYRFFIMPSRASTAFWRSWSGRKHFCGRWSCCKKVSLFTFWYRNLKLTPFEITALQAI